MMFQGGQPLNIGCPISVAAGTGCNAVKVAGQSQKLGIKTKIDKNGFSFEPFLSVRTKAVNIKSGSFTPPTPWTVLSTGPQSATFRHAERREEMTS